jgi:hypothetical protein
MAFFGLPGATKLTHGSKGLTNPDCDHAPWASKDAHVILAGQCFGMCEFLIFNPLAVNHSMLTFEYGYN